jgi:hypothetical protein
MHFEGLLIKCSCLYNTEKACATEETGVCGRSFLYNFIQLMKDSQLTLLAFREDITKWGNNEVSRRMRLSGEEPKYFTTKKQRWGEESTSRSLILLLLMLLLLLMIIILIIASSIFTFAESA